MNQYETIYIDRIGYLGWIVLNRPVKYNCFNEKLMGEVMDALKNLEKDDNIRVIAFRGEGKTFASGADISDLQTMSALDALFPTMQALYQQIYHYPKPTIAAVQGYALGGGMELAASCDLRLAADNVKFGLPECKLGVIPGAGGTQRLVRLIGEAKVKELIFTGKMLNGHEALDLGFISSLVPVEELLTKTMELAESVAERSPLALKFAKIAINRSQDIPLETGLLMENMFQAILFSSPDKTEGVSAFLEKRKPHF